MGRGYSIEIVPTSDDKGLVEAFDNENSRLVFLSRADDEIKQSIEEAGDSIISEIIRNKKS